MKAKSRLLVALLLFTLSLTTVPQAGYAVSPVAQGGGARFISDTVADGSVVGGSFAGGRYLFWVDTRDSVTSIYGYDLEAGIEFPVLTPFTPVDVGYLAVNGDVLVWVESRPGGLGGIKGYRLSSAEHFTVVEAGSPTEFGGLALDGDTLYYVESSQDGTGSCNGLYARDLTTGADLLITSSGRDPVAADDLLLWSEEHRAEAGRYGVSEWKLRALKRGSSDPQMVTEQNGGFSGYGVSGSKIVWAAYPPAGNQYVHLYDFNTGATGVLSNQDAVHPLISGDNVVWTVGADGTAGAKLYWSLQVYDSLQGDTAAIIDYSDAPVNTAAIIGGTTLAFTVDRDTTELGVELYVTDLTQRGLRFEAVGASTSSSTCKRPIVCGHVYARDINYLADNAGTWPVNGVQIFQPKFGINGRTFYHENYSSPENYNEVNYWMYRAGSDYLRAKTVRVFIDAPDSAGNSPTWYEDIYKLVRRANNLNLRVGLVLHNLGDVRAMTDAQKNWYIGLIHYLQNDPFTHTNWTPAVAYASADNEINNKGCTDSRGVYDCYDDPTHVNDGNKWVRDFTQIFRQTGSGILTTVGISTEFGDEGNRDPYPEVNGFYRWPTDGTGTLRLVDYVDFISPHNYGGGARLIFEQIETRRIFGPDKPVVLEEYGWPTDPYVPFDPLFDVCNPTAPPRFYEPNKPNWYREGCWGNQWKREECPHWFYNTNPPAPHEHVWSASYMVETNAQAIRGKPYAGGVAWMVSDVVNDPRQPEDTLTGLLAWNRPAYNGTCHTGFAEPKAPGFRVRTHHTYFNPNP